jgi:hypothetical protein
MEIAKRGKFGETEDDVLRDLFKLPRTVDTSVGVLTRPRNAQLTPRRTIAAQRMSSYIALNRLHVEFQGGVPSSWDLPNPKDKAAIRAVLDKALAFARANDASLGQLNAVRKTLTDQGYHLTK